MATGTLVAKGRKQKPTTPGPPAGGTAPSADEDFDDEKATEPVRLPPSFKERLETIKARINRDRKRRKEESLSLGDIIQLGMKDWLNSAENRYGITPQPPAGG